MTFAIGAAVIPRGIVERGMRGVFLLGMLLRRVGVICCMLRIQMASMDIDAGLAAGLSSA